MGKNGVKFDKTPKDEEKFEELRELYGSEQVHNYALRSKIAGNTILLVDPPWEYPFSIDARGDPNRHYPPMSINTIKGHPIPDIENSVLYLWATAPLLLGALDVMKTWGYSYKTHIVWDKVNIGTGYWSRGRHELLLIGVKGKFSPPPKEALTPSVLVEKRTTHSTKPQCVYEMIEAQFPDVPKIELFAREEREGWNSEGIEIDN